MTGNGEADARIGRLNSGVGNDRIYEVCSLTDIRLNVPVASGCFVVKITLE